jgi:anti-sigma B factor antagonist/stage II sporulation protein AA (anti-sigma F factor antagonist)
LEDVVQEIISDVIIIRINLLSATVNESSELRNLLDEQITHGYFKIVVDLSQCNYMDTTFIGVLVATHKKLLTKGGKLNIVSKLDPKRELFFNLTGINKVFNTFETSEDAVSSFSNRINPTELKSDEVISKKSVPWDFT